MCALIGVACCEQCSQCLEGFLGNPVDGNQCYRMMTIDNVYCFDPTSQANCFPRQPFTLGYGQTVLFSVQPKYLNVDIRIVIDVSAGGIFSYLLLETFIGTARLPVFCLLQCPFCLTSIM